MDAIDLTIPPGSGASLEARNLSGGIASDVGRVARTGAGHRLIVKGTGPQIRLHNVNGGISIRSTERPCTRRLRQGRRPAGGQPA
jgi:hypothetical protein